MGWSTAQAAVVFARLGIINHVEAACGAPPKRSKYNAVPVTIDGIRFASGAEGRAYQTLKIAEKHGLVSDLKLQPRYELQAKFTDAQGKKHRAIEYRGDFEFVRDGRRTVVDVKGREAPGFRAKWKMAIKLYPEITFELWK